ncbi:hypothetical protein I548_2054 [Mycobacterium intracellulare]|nr:hypothetical protein I548_2054 [Mycobacterium intracellulare]
MFPAVAEAAASSRSAATTRSPRAASPSAIALPMPEPAPVTTARPSGEWVFIADESRFTAAAGSRIEALPR